MKTVPLVALAIVAGLAAGGGASFATGLILGTWNTAPGPAKPVPPPVPTFVPMGKVLAPLVFSTGRLAGYVSFEVQLETSEEKAEFVKARLPYLLNAINMRTYRTVMTSGPDGMLPDLAAFRAVVMAASVETFGPGVVKHAAITQATPG